MKKLIISLAVFGVYIIYSLGMRHQNPLVGKPTALTSNTSSKSAASNTATTAAPPAVTNNNNVTSYKDGTYTGTVADAYYGNVQVAATISGGKIVSINFLQYPNSHSTSVAINQQAIPYLQQEAIQAQNPNVQIISGATFTSQAFQQSLQAALSQA